MKSVDVIIVNYRTPDLSKQACDSVLTDPAVNKVWIVDNSSADDSCQLLQKYAAGKPVEVISSTENLGFGEANNLAAKKSTARYIFLLNSDATLFAGNLESLVDNLEQAESVGIVAPQILLTDEQAVQLDAQGIFPTASRIIFRKTRQYIQSQTPDWVSGVSLLVRREEFLNIGGFDKEYFMYFEDVDLCWRYRQSGKKIVVVPEVKVVHLGGGSHSSTSKQKQTYFSSQRLFLRKSGAGRITLLLLKIITWIYGKRY